MLKIVNHSSDRPPIWVLDKSFTIGSSEDNNLILDEPSVNPQHAKIVKQDGTYLIKDMGSQSGTYVNKRRVNQIELHSKDKLHIGDVELEVLDPINDPSCASSIHGWSLVACSSWLAGQEFKIHSLKGRETITVGRGNHCDVIFPGTHLSREHVAIKIAGAELIIKDLNSANGTFVNDQRITTGKLKAGDTLRLDVYSFRVVGPNEHFFNLDNASEHPEDIFSRDTRLRSDPQAANTPKPMTAIDSQRQRKWKTRPTSPGNRDEPSEKSVYTNVSIILASLLLASAIGLGVYLLL